MYELAFYPGVEKDLRKLDRPTGERILSKIHWLCEHVELIRHEPLTAQWAGLYKLRVGDYRVVYELDLERKRIVVYAIGHRKDIYEIR